MTRKPGPRATFRSRWAILVAAALLISLGVARRWWPPRRRAASDATSRALWALPETDTERRALAAAEGSRRSERLGDYYLAAGRPFAAVWQFQEALAGGTAGSAARIALTARLAAALQEGRWYGPAIRLLEPIAAEVPGDSAVRRQLATLYLATGRPEPAVRVLIAGLRDARGFLSPLAAAPRMVPTQLLAFGEACQAAGAAGAARLAYERAVRETPRDPEALLRLGRLLLRDGRPEKAVALFRQAGKLSSHDPRPLYNLGRAFMERSGTANREYAARCFARVTDLAPGYVPAWLQLGAFHQQARRGREAGHAYLEVLRLDANNVEAHRSLGQLMSALGEPALSHYHAGWAFVFEDQPQLAVEQFRAMGAADPDGVEAPLLISQGYTQMAQNVRAADEIRQALRRHPHDPKLYGRLAGLDFITHNRRATAALCAEWRHFQPEAAEPLWLEGKLAVADHRLDEGIRRLAQAAAQDPARAEYAFDLGEVLARRPSRENLSRALPALSRAVTLTPDEPRYRYQLAVVLQRLGEREGARRQFLRVLDRDPNHVQAVNSLVQMAQALQRPRLAQFWASMVPRIQDSVQEEKELRRRIGQQPADVEGHLRLAQLLIRRGDLRKARAHQSWALRLSPRRAPVRAERDRVDRILDVLEE